MQIQVHSDNHIEGSARLVDWVSASVASKLERFDDELTRIVVHLNDENGEKAGAQLPARLPPPRIAPSRRGE